MSLEKNGTQAEVYGESGQRRQRRRSTKSVRLNAQGTQGIAQVSVNESSPLLISHIAYATQRPGIARKTVFSKDSARVYAYSILPSDLSKIVREDANGRKVVGRLIGHQFRAIKTKTAKSA